MDKRKPFSTVCPLCQHIFIYCNGIDCNKCGNFLTCLEPECRCCCDVVDVLRAVQSQMIELEIEVNHLKEEKKNERR